MEPEKAGVRRFCILYYTNQCIGIGPVQREKRMSDKLQHCLQRREQKVDTMSLYSTALLASWSIYCAALEKGEGRWRHASLGNYWVSSAECMHGTWNLDGSWEVTFVKICGFLICHACMRSAGGAVAPSPHWSCRLSITYAKHGKAPTNWLVKGFD